MGRTDGRQLISIFRAAAQASASGADQHAKVRTFIMDKDMWEGKYQEHRWLSGPYEAAPPDFGSLDPNVLTASLPIFGTVRTLELQAQRRKDEGLGPIIEQNLMALFKGMPDLEDLTLHNPMRLGPLRMRAPIESISSTSLRCLRLETCVLHQQGLETFLQKQAKTLKVLHLKSIMLEAGHFVQFFNSIRNLLDLQAFSLEGSLVEVEDDSLLYFTEEEIDDETFYEVKERRMAARAAIEAFVRKETEVFPVELLDVDSSGFTDFSNSEWGGMTIVLGMSKLYDSQEVDF